MRSTTRFTLIPHHAALTIVARGPMSSADADRLAALCLSLPAEVPMLCIDLTAAGLIGADVLRRVSRAASSWRYARRRAVTLRFVASRLDPSSAAAADEVPVEVRYAARTPVPRQGLPLVPRAVRGRSAFAVASTRPVAQASV